MRTECQRKIILIHLSLYYLFQSLPDHFCPNFLVHWSPAPKYLAPWSLSPQWSLLDYSSFQITCSLIALLLPLTRKCKLLFWSFTLLFHILSMITQQSVWSRLYIQSSIIFLTTGFSSKQENNDSKNFKIKIRKIIYVYHLISWFFFQMGKYWL